jgi:hypothetical protein
MSEDIFDPKNVPESNWFKMETVGTKVSGLLTENPYIKKDMSGQFGDQRVFVMQQADGSTINFGIRVDKDYLMQRTNKLRAGDMVGFEFVKEIPATKKGYNPAKSIEVYVKLTEEGDRVREFEKDPSKF